MHRSEFPETFSYVGAGERGPFAVLVELVELLGRVHSLQALRVEAADRRATENLKDRTRELVAGLKRLYASMPAAIACSLTTISTERAMHPLRIAVVSVSSGLLGVRDSKPVVRHVVSRSTGHLLHTLLPAHDVLCNSPQAQRKFRLLLEWLREPKGGRHLRR